MASTMQNKAQKRKVADSPPETCRGAPLRVKPVRIDTQEKVVHDLEELGESCDAGEIIYSVNLARSLPDVVESCCLQGYASADDVVRLVSALMRPDGTVYEYAIQLTEMTS